MKSNIKKHLRRVFSFLLVFVMTMQVSITGVFAASEFAGALVSDLSRGLIAFGNNLISPLANNDEGIDIFTVDGSYLTIKGQGIYATPSNESNSYGDTKYIIKATAPLTSLTYLRIKNDVSASVTLSSVNSSYIFLVLEENASLELTLNGDCGIGGIELGSGATLTVTGDSLSFDSLTYADGATNTSVSFSNIPAVFMTGGISAHSVSLTNVDITASAESYVRSEGDLSIDSVVIGDTDGELIDEITAKSDLTVRGSSTYLIAKKVGIAPDGSGEVSLIGIGKIRAESVGAIVGDGGVSFANPVRLEMDLVGYPVQIWDYNIQYMNYGNVGYEKLTPQSGTATAYRVKIDGTSEKTIVGYHNAEGLVPGSTVPVSAVPTRENYDFRAWSLTPMTGEANFASDKTNEQWLSYDGKEWDAENSVIKDAADPVKGYEAATITSDNGNVVLYAIYVPVSVVVKLHTNTDDDTVFAAFPAYVGAKGTSIQDYLNDPSLDIEGQNAQSFADAPKDGNSVNVLDFSVSSDDGDGIFDLYVVWSSGHIRVDYNIPEYFEGYKYQYLDKNGVWQDIPAASLNELNEKIKELIGSHDIYFGNTYGDMLEIRCVNADGAGSFEYNFVGWYILSPTGEKILLDKYTVVSSYTTTANALTTGSQIIFALFENTRYTLTVPSTLGKWEFTDENGNVIAFTSNGDGTMSAYINSDTTVFMNRADETTVSSYWRLTNGSDGSFIWPAELPSSNGGSYWLKYTFTMPKANVTAVYDETVRWDTAMGDFTFGTYDFNGRSSYGFIITDRYTGDILHQFRWIMNKTVSSSSTTYLTTVYFTSSVETDHKIYLDGPTALYLDGVKLAERGDILNQLASFYNKGIYESAVNVYPFAANQNIIFDNNPDVTQAYNATTTYTVTINVLNDSKVFAIGQKAWLTNITNAWAKQYRTTVVVNGNEKHLDFYSLLLHTGATTINKCIVDVLTTDHPEIDSAVHWLHFDSTGSTISGCTINANGRSLFARHGGKINSNGNSVNFNVKGNSAITNIGEMHIPNLKAENSVFTADKILSVGYSFSFKNTTVTANIIGYNGNIHVTFSNYESTFANSTITVNDWMSVARPRIYSGTVLNVANGLHIYESVKIYGSGTTVNVGSIGRFRTLSGTSSQDGQHYSGTDMNHFFYVDIYGGAKVTVNGDVNLGVNHSSMPEINVYGDGTEVIIKGDADVTNIFNIESGANVSVDGSLTLHQDLNVEGATLTVGHDLYHTIFGKGDTEYKTVTDANGVSENLFWGFSFADDATVHVGGNVGNKTSADKTSVVYSKSNANVRIDGNVSRDIVII